jgi:hypothetical protein
MHGVLIGLDYRSSGRTSKWLNGVKNDLDLLRESLRIRGVNDDNIISVTDSISREAAISLLARAVSCVQEGDQLFLYFTGVPDARISLGEVAWEVSLDVCGHQNGWQKVCTFLMENRDFRLEVMDRIVNPYNDLLLWLHLSPSSEA